MTKLDDVARTLNTVGLAAWFGGSLMGAVALRGVDHDPAAPGSGAENDAWARWTPVQTAAIGAHLLGAAKLATTNKGRVVGQKGVGKVAVFKAVCTAGALGATVYASKLGKEVHAASADGSAPGAGTGTVGGGPTSSAPNGSSSSAGASDDTLRRLRAAQVAVPVLTGAMLVADARLGEQQRPMEVLRGMAARAVPDSLSDALPSLPDPLSDVLPSPPTIAGVAAAVKGIPEAAKHLPDAARHLPDAARHVPEQARELVSR